MTPDPSTGDGPPEGLPPGYLYRVAWVLYLVLAIVGLAWIGWREGVVGLGVFVDLEMWWRDLGVGLAGAAALLALWHLARRWLALAQELEDKLARMLASVQPGEAWALALLSGFAEEVFFRGAVMGAFESGGWLWSSLLFALLHTGTHPAFRLWTAFAFVAGLTFAGLVVLTGNLLAPVLAHAAVNAFNLSRLAAAGRTSAGPDA